MARGRASQKEEHAQLKSYDAADRQEFVLARAAFEALPEIDEFVDAEAGGRGLGEP